MPVKVTDDFARLAVGTQVEKISGYPFPGTIIMAGRTLTGQERFVVEATGAEYAGMLHIFNGAQLRAVSSEATAKALSEMIGKAIKHHDLFEEERQAQRESFARGTPCEHGILDFEQCPQCRHPEAETRWCPADWLDEDAPVLADDPADCVYPGGPTGWLMVDDPDNLDDEENFYRMEIDPGEIVNFCGLRSYGKFALIVRDDRTFDIDTYPADATHFRHVDADEDDTYESVADLVEKGEQPDGGDPLSAGAHEIAIWHWSDEIPFRFEVEDGKPRFVRCGEEA